MNSKELIAGEVPAPRFEFRSFGRQFDEAAKRMARLSVPVPEKIWERHSDEIYILSRTNDLNNTKIRDGKMDIKTLVQTVNGLEQWNPLMKAAFPISAAVLKNEVFPAFQVTIPEFTEEAYTYDTFIEMIRQHPGLLAVNVHKQRFAYMVNNTICETGNIYINGAKLVTISSESTSVDDIAQTIRAIGLEGVENINYLQAIKRVTGMISKPLAN